jgi:hypothetical protein
MFCRSSPVNVQVVAVVNPVGSAAQGDYWRNIAITLIDLCSVGTAFNPLQPSVGHDADYSGSGQY